MNKKEALNILENMNITDQNFYNCYLQICDINEKLKLNAVDYWFFATPEDLINEINLHLKEALKYDYEIEDVFYHYKNIDLTCPLFVYNELWETWGNATAETIQNLKDDILNLNYLED